MTDKFILNLYFGDDKGAFACYFVRTCSCGDEYTCTAFQWGGVDCRIVRRPDSQNALPLYYENVSKAVLTGKVVTADTEISALLKDFNARVL